MNVLAVLAVVLEALAYAAALLGAGSVLARISLNVRETADGLVRGSGALLAMCALASALLYALRLDAGWDTSALRAVYASPLGAALALHLAGGLLLCLRPRGVAASLAAMLALAAFAISGHAASRGIGTALLLLVHIAAAAWWAGSLSELLRTRRAREPAAWADLVARFSRQAIVVVATLVLAGGLQTGLLLEWRFDPAQAYARTLAVKLCLVAGLLALANHNRVALLPLMRAGKAQGARLQRRIAVELGLIATILAATAVLTAHIGLHRAAAPAPRVVATLAGLAIADPWVAAMPPGVRQAAGYLSLVNASEQHDRLLAATSPRAARVTLHRVTDDGQLIRMRRIEALDLPARSSTSLAPGKMHLMFEGVATPFGDGEWIEVELQFERRGAVSLLFPVQYEAGKHAGH